MLHGSAGVAQMPPYEPALAPPAAGRTTVGVFQTDIRESPAAEPHDGAWERVCRRIKWAGIGVAALTATMIYGNRLLEGRASKQKQKNNWMRKATRGS